MVGKRIRMGRIMDRKSGKVVIIPMDHGVTLGPVTGLIDMRETIDAVAMGGANAILIHKGLVEIVERSRKGLGLIIHLSASTRIAPDPNSKTIVCTGLWVGWFFRKEDPFLLQLQMNNTGLLRSL
jgi:DhnA family fructose-bisphosphate aldolase class Ia